MSFSSRRYLKRERAKTTFPNDARNASLAAWGGKREGGYPVSPFSLPFGAKLHVLPIGSSSSSAFPNDISSGLPAKPSPCLIAKRKEFLMKIQRKVDEIKMNRNGHFCVTSQPPGHDQAKGECRQRKCFY
ncbi:hypothetical protein CEXT_743361 [Caerostris extrusa]|uniref:Uncharacterized protein n=1 Tax=Caerostris extrusa TaxID=172846 RepID=A0AAV4VTU7_CAEEX|nr:hypothetical protein CEXT_743361 [Caerostris extrusa]